MLVHRLRRWPNIKPALVEHPLFALVLICDFISGLSILYGNETLGKPPRTWTIELCTWNLLQIESSKNDSLIQAVAYIKTTLDECAMFTGVLVWFINN